MMQEPWGLKKWAEVFGILGGIAAVVGVFLAVGGGDGKSPSSAVQAATSTTQDPPSTIPSYTTSTEASTTTSGPTKNTYIAHIEAICAAANSEIEDLGGTPSALNDKEGYRRWVRDTTTIKYHMSAEALDVIMPSGDEPQLIDAWAKYNAHLRSLTQYHNALQRYSEERNRDNEKRLWDATDETIFSMVPAHKAFKAYGFKTCLELIGIRL